MVVHGRRLSAADKAIPSCNLTDLVPSWSVELHVFSAQNVSLVLMPEGADDVKGPTFIIQQDGTGFRLDQLWWDFYTELGTFPCLVDLTAAVRTRLIHLLTTARPASQRLH